MADSHSNRNPNFCYHRPMDGAAQSPVHKKPRSQQRRGKGKVCLALQCVKLNEIRECEYNLCIVDLFGPDNSPQFYRIDVGSVPNVISTDAFCVLGDKLYVFEACYDDGSSTKAVYSFDIDISSKCSEIKTLIKNDASKAGEMMSPKLCPAAVAAPDGRKILVFSSQDISVSCARDLGRFELFDTVEGSSEWLPSIDVDRLCPYSISAYGFLDGTKFLVQMSLEYRIRLYVFDFDSWDEGWVRMDTLCGHGDVLTSPFFATSFLEVVEGRFCIETGHGVFDLLYPEDEYGPEPYNLFMMADIDPNDCFDLDYLVAFLDHNEPVGECTFCEVRLDRFPTQESVSFRLDVCVADVEVYKQDLMQDIHKSRIEYTRGIKTLQFELKLEQECQVLEPVFFSF